MVLELFSLSGRVALITGASRGLGQAIAIGLAQAGADIAGVSISGEDQETAELVAQAGRSYRSIKADVSQPADRARLVEEAHYHYPQLDILVSNAGSGTRHPPEIFPMEEWNQTIETHLTAAFDLSQRVAPGMLARGRGKIILIGSVMSFEGGWNIPAYAAVKHGLAGLTKSLATAWASKGINVNCIAPGYFETNLLLQDDLVRGPQILDRIPAGRWGHPDEIAGLAVFLASAASNFMHGSVVPIDGGWLAR